MHTGAEPNFPYSAYKAKYWAGQEYQRSILLYTGMSQGMQVPYLKEIEVEVPGQAPVCNKAQWSVGQFRADSFERADAAKLVGSWEHVAEHLTEDTLRTM